MNSQKIKTNSYCVGGKHHTATKIITPEKTTKKKLVKRLSY